MDKKTLKIMEAVDCCGMGNAIINYDPLINIKDFCIDTERISICLNNELAEFGFKSTLSPEKTIIYIDDGVKSQICNILSDKTVNIKISKNQVDSLYTIMDVVKTKEVPIIWKLLIS